MDNCNWVQAYISCPAQTWKRMTQCTWDISLDSCVFLPPAFKTAASCIMCFSSGKKLSPYCHWSPCRVSLEGPLPFWCLCHSTGCYRKKDTATSVLLALQGGKESTATLWTGGCRSQGGHQAGHELGLVGRFGDRESPWAGGTGTAAKHLVSIRELCEDEDCCTQDGCCGFFGVFFFAFSPSLFWGRFCCIQAGLQTTGSVHRLQQLYFHAGLTGAIFWGVSVSPLKEGWWEYGGCSNGNCNWSCLFDFFTQTKCLVPIS